MTNAKEDWPMRDITADGGTWMTNVKEDWPMRDITRYSELGRFLRCNESDWVDINWKENFASVFRREHV
jgi:hypothetical protein